MSHSADLSMADLADQHCQPRKGDDHLLTASHRYAALEVLEGWNEAETGRAIVRRFSFSDFHRTMAFVNALAFIAHREDHHPDMKVGYNYCEVLFSTHDVGGLSENDLICAAKTSLLFEDGNR